MLPHWLKKKLHCGTVLSTVEQILDSNRLNTVCEQSLCPNRGECFSRGALAFQILGNICTRNCAFCGEKKGHPLPPDPGEPERIAQTTIKLKLKHVVITSPSRDDLPDGGAIVFAETVKNIRRLNINENKEITIEVLVPDFAGKDASIDTVLKERPNVFNHNMETVAELQPKIRPLASYERSLHVLQRASSGSHNGIEKKIIVKSGLMVGLGEDTDELKETFDDIASCGVNVLTIGQYLPPSLQHRKAVKFYSPEEFSRLKETAVSCGIKNVYSGPFIRSSYNAEEIFAASRSN